MKKKIIVMLLSLTILLTMTVVAEAASATKPINVTYQDIKLYVNGTAVSVQANEEPFIYDGRNFLPTRAIAEALNLKVEWDAALKAVKISGAENSAATSLKDMEIQSLKMQLSQRDNEIQNLKNTIASLEADNGSDDGIADLEDDLKDEYDYLEDVEIDDIILDGDEDDVDVDVEVDLGDYEDEWADLDDRDIEDWLEDLVDSIQSELSDDTVIDGKIIDIDSDDVLVDFYKDGDDDLEIDFRDEDYRNGGSGSDADDVEDSLEGEDYYVGGIEFSIDSVYYDDDDDNVTAYLYAYDDDASSDWDDLSSSEIEDDVVSICEDIADAFEDEDIRVDTVTLYFYDEDEDYLDDFDYDADEGELE